MPLARSNHVMGQLLKPSASMKAARVSNGGSTGSSQGQGRLDAASRAYSSTKAPFCHGLCFSWCCRAKHGEPASRKADGTVRPCADVRWLVHGEWRDESCTAVTCEAGERLDQLGTDKPNLVTYNIPHLQPPQRDPLGHQHERACRVWCSERETLKGAELGIEEEQEEQGLCSRQRPQLQTGREEGFCQRLPYPIHPSAGIQPPLWVLPICNLVHPSVH